MCRCVITAVLLLALVARGLVPAGFMVQPANAEAGSALEIAICTSSGLKTSLDRNDEAPPSTPQDVEDGLCPFAASASAGTPPATPQTVAWTAAVAAVTYTLAVRRFVETRKAGAVSARGPPSPVI